MSERLRLDFSNMLAPNLGGRGLDPAALDDARSRFADLHAAVERRRAAGELAFFDLPYQPDAAGEIRAFADGAGQAFHTIVVLGIGGSALGAIALQRALLRPFWNELSEQDRDYFPRFYVLGNVDPTTIGPFLDTLELGGTLFNVVSKSGGTTETMALYLVVRERLLHAFGDDGCRRHLVFTTDPERGVLRRIADDEGIVAFPVPPGVGGRFSVLSAVGLLPAALVGLDVEGLLAGARAMDERCRTDALDRNPAGMYAVLQHAAHADAGASIHVMMAYSDRLGGVADWFRQLWAESLGKRLDLEGREVFRGPTPVKAVGATDQHSQVQLYVEGPFDKTVTFLAADELPVDVAIPAGHPEYDDARYLGGRTLGELLRAERIATAHALARSGRMNMSIHLPRIDAFAIGELLMMLQAATLYAGALYGVDPLDQPGVELGKRLTYALLGRPGHDTLAVDRPGPRHRIE